MVSPAAHSQLASWAHVTEHRADPTENPTESGPAQPCGPRTALVVHHSKVYERSKDSGLQFTHHFFAQRPSPASGLCISLPAPQGAAEGIYARPRTHNVTFGMKAKTCFVVPRLCRRGISYRIMLR